MARLTLFLSLLLSNLVRAEEPEESPEGPVEKWDVLATHGPHHEAAFSLEEGTWMSVSLSGDRLVFDLLGDIWSMPLSGGEARRITSDAAWDSEPRFSPDGRQIAFVSDRDGNEQIWVMDADGTDLRKVTDESEARVTDPVWDPTGDWLIVRRRTVDTRSIGVTELWQVHLEGESPGFALTKLDEDPHAGESTTDGRYIWFSSRHGRFEYDQDPVAGLWSIKRLDRQTGEIRVVVHGPGSAARPKLSPDGQRLAFISRDRTKTLLEVIDLPTGRRRVISDALSHDQLEAFALHGVYPDMSWLPDGSGLVLWAQGRLWRMGLDGKKQEIPFLAKGSWVFHDVPRWRRSIEDEVRARVIRWPVFSPDGRLAFSALGRLWLREKDGAISQLSEGTGYAPAWSPDGKQLAWTSWTDCRPNVLNQNCGGRLHITRGKRTQTLPVEGQLVNPAWSEDGRTLVVLRGVGGGVSPDLGDEPWYELVLLEQQGRDWKARAIASTEIHQFRAPRPTVHGGRVYWSETRPTQPRQPEETVLVSVDLNGLDKRIHLVLPGAQEVRLSPDLSRIAYKEGHQAWVAAFPAQAREVPLSAVPRRKVSQVVGDWLEWKPGSRVLSWMEGPVLHELAIDRIHPDDDEAEKDRATAALSIDLKLPRHRPQSLLALTHARVLTMEPGTPVIEDATILIEGDRIRSITAGGPVPAGATVRNLAGNTVIPGLIDVHAHMHYTAGDALPEQEWRYLTALDFGVTTVHDPSASTDLVFTQKERVEAGFMKGPRVFSTGYVLYGALGNANAVTPDREAALNHVQRLKAVGAGSVKVYQQSRRDQRQWYVDACNNEQMLCVAEGGGDLFMNLGMVADGFQAVEHALPVAPLYEDVQQWMAASRTASTGGTAYTPTLLVAYGGLAGENWFFQKENPRDHARLLRHYPRRQLDARAWRLGMMAADEDFNHVTVARDAARMARSGTLVTLGAHGQLQGLGVHWELWAMASEGAMTPEEALRAATIEGARYLGLQHEIGSLAPGKLADLVVLEGDPREDIRRSDDIVLVVKNGEVFE